MHGSLAAPARRMPSLAGVRSTLHVWWRMLAVLALVLLAASLLGYWAWLAAARQTALADALVRADVRALGQQFIARSSDELYVGATTILRAVGAGRRATEDVPVDMSAFRDAALAAQRCRCAPVFTPAWGFRADMGSPELSIVGTPDSAVLGRWLRAAISERARRLVRGWDVASLPDLDPIAGRLVFIAPRARDSTGAATEIVGFAVDSATVSREVFAQRLRRIRSYANSTAASHHARAFVARVRDRAGGVIWQSDASAAYAFGASVGFIDIWDGWTVDAALDRSSASVMAALPGSPLPSLIAMFAVAATLVATALFLMWRMMQLSRLRADFTSSVSHELRTPLTQILLFAETLKLQRDDSPAVRARATDVIAREARRVIYLVDNILRFSRAEHGVQRIEPRPHRLEPIVRSAIDAFQPIADARRVRVVLHADESATASVDADALRQIVANLLDNAVRYGPEGQTIDVRVARQDERVLLTVSDNGPGIAPGDRERVWKSFVRLERATGSTATGTGIGLAIVNDLVVAHGGRRSVSSEGGGGARITIDLPAAAS